MYCYIPPFNQDHIREVALRRGLLMPDETITTGIDRVVRSLARVDARLLNGGGKFADELNEAMQSGRLAASSQLFTAAGRALSVAACTVLPVVGNRDASRIRSLVAEATAASASGMGCGVDISEFTDPAWALATLNAAMQELHAKLVALKLRPPALMVSCRADHPRINEFIDAKRNEDFARWVANISVKVSADDAEWQRIRSRLAAAAHRNGEPGVLFHSVADADNPTPEIKLTSTAPCAEVFLAPGERCVFMSVNLAAHVVAGAFDWTGFEASIRLAVRASDAAVELAARGASPIVARRRRIGVGVCGYHSCLILLGIPYAQSTGFAGEVSEQITFTAHGASADLAARRGPFPLWPSSRWRSEAWLRRKAHWRNGAVSRAAWGALEARILAAGVRNAAIVAYPPTGVVAELLGVSRSYEPHYTLVGQTGVASSFKLAVAPEAEAALALEASPMAARAAILDPASGYQLPGADAGHLLACARQLPAMTHLDIHAAFSCLADESGSKTVNLPPGATIDAVAELMDRARVLGLKGLTVFRDGCLAERTTAT